MIDFNYIFDDDTEKQLLIAIERSKAGSRRLLRALINARLVIRRSLETVTVSGAWWRQLSDFRKRDMARMFLEATQTGSITILEDGTGKVIALTTAPSYREAE